MTEIFLIPLKKPCVDVWIISPQILLLFTGKVHFKEFKNHTSAHDFSGYTNFFLRAISVKGKLMT
jgi:hypothetical protein